MVKGQDHRDKNNEKVRHFARESPLRRGPRAAFFRERSSGRGPLRQWENQRMLFSFSLKFETLVSCIYPPT